MRIAKAQVSQFATHLKGAVQDAAAGQAGVVDTRALSPDDARVIQSLTGKSGDAPLRLEDAIDAIEGMADKLLSQDSAARLSGAGIGVNAARLVGGGGRADGLLDEREQSAFLKMVGMESGLDFLQRATSFMEQGGAVSPLLAQSAQIASARRGQRSGRAPSRADATAPSAGGAGAPAAGADTSARRPPRLRRRLLRLRRLSLSKRP